MCIVAFKRLLLVWKGLCVSFGGWGKMCEFVSMLFWTRLKSKSMQANKCPRSPYPLRKNDHKLGFFC